MITRSKKYAFIIGCWFIMCLQPVTGSGANLVQKLRHGSIDWTNRVIEAIGQSNYPEGDEDPRARSLARNMAIKKARDNLLSIIMDLPLDSNKPVSHFIMGDKERLEKLMSFIRHAELAKVTFGQDKQVKVTLSIKFSGPLAELILPEYIKKIEPLIKIRGCTKNSNNFYTGILIDCSEIDFQPCLIPRIVNEKGEEVFGPAYVSRDCVSKGGMAKFVVAPDKRINALWLGNKILSLKALRVSVANPNIVVLTNSDAETIRANPLNLSLLHDCKVVFVLGKTAGKRQRGRVR